MAELKAVDYARFALRKRDRPFVLTRIAIAYLLCVVLIGAAALAVAWPAVGPMISWYGQLMQAAMHGGEAPTPPLQMLFSVAPIYTLALLVGLIVYAAFEAACLRWMVRGDASPLGLSLGADTWRVVLVYLTWFALGLASLLVVVGLYAGLWAAGRFGNGAIIAATLFGALAPLGLLALLMWVSVRLSPAAAISVAKGRYAFFSAWRATRGRFWEFLGGFVIVFVAYLVLSTLLSLPIRGVMMQAMYPAMMHAAGGDPAEMMNAMWRQMTSPLALGVFAFYIACALTLGMITRIFWFGINAGLVSSAQAPETASA